jgi:hypothetical protein
MKALKWIAFLAVLAQVTIAATSPPATRLTWVQPTTDTEGNPITVTRNSAYCGESLTNLIFVYHSTAPITEVLIDEVITLPSDNICVVTAWAYSQDGVERESAYSNMVTVKKLSEGEILVFSAAPAAPSNLSAE